MRAGENWLLGAGSVPRPPRDALRRRRLLDSLHDSIGRGLIVVQAPAGFGKTTLVAQFVAEDDLEFAPVWLTLDTSCRTAEGFAARLAAAALRDEAWAPVSATLGEDTRTYLASILGRWRERSSLPPIVVLDSLEELGPDAPAWTLIDWLTEALRDWGELVLVSREPIARRSVDRRLVGGDAIRIGASELRFTAEEVEELCRRAGATCNANDLFESTGGWPIAVIGVVRGAIPVSAARGALPGSSWERYLAAEVWHMAPHRLRPALLQLSVPPVCDSAVGNGLVGAATWEAVFAWASECGLLVEPQTDGSLRILPPLRTFLLQEFERADPDGKRATTHLVVSAYLSAGNFLLALTTATELREESLIVDVLQNHASELIERGAFDLIAKAFDVLAPERVARAPLLRALRARAWSLSNNAKLALQEGRAVLEDEQAPPTARFHGALAATRAARLLGRRNVAFEVLERAEELVPQLDADSKQELAWYEAHTIMALDSDFERAEQLLAEVARDAGAESPLGLLALSALGQSLGMRGAVPEAVECLSRASIGWQNLRALGNLPWVLNNLSVAHLAVGDVESALDAGKAARDVARTAHNARALAYATASIGDALLASGNSTDAAGAYREALQLCEGQVADEALAAMVIAGLSATALASGDLVEADVYAKRAVLIAETLGSPYELAACYLQAAMVSSASGNHAAALHRCDEAVRLARRIGAEVLVRQAVYRKALCAFRAGKRDVAQACLVELGAIMRQPWHAGALSILAREDFLFAQWAAMRDSLPEFARQRLRESTFAACPAGSNTYRPFPSVRVESLGELSIFRDGVRIPEEAFASAKAIEFFLLFMARRGGMGKEEVVVELYPDLPASRCNSAFHSNLYRVRKALYPECIVRRGHTYVLNPDGEFSWDVDEFRNAIEAARDAPPGSARRAELFEEAVRRYRGPFATTVHSEWAATLRAALDRAAVEALATLAGFHAARGEFEAAANYLERVLAADPLNDEAVYHLARFRAQAGNPTAALTLIDQFGQLFRQELGDELPERLRRLRQAIATAGVG